MIGSGTLCEAALLSRCSMGQQCGPVCHATTAGMKWNKANKVVVYCWYRNKFFDEDRKPVKGSFFRKCSEKVSIIWN